MYILDLDEAFQAVKPTAEEYDGVPCQGGIARVEVVIAQGDE